MSGAFPRRVPLLGAILKPASTVNWTHVQSAITNAAGVSSVSLAFGSNITRGNLLVVHGLAHTGGTVETLSVSDTKLFAYTQSNDCGWSSSDNTRLTQWYTRVLSAGADTVTVTMSSGTGNMLIQISEFSPGPSPIGMTVAVDGTNSNTYSSGTLTPSAGTVAVTGASDLAVCCLGQGSTGGVVTWTPGSGWTSGATQNGSPNGASEYQLNISSAVTANWTVDDSQKWCILGTTWSAS